MEYLVKRRLYKGGGEYSEVGEKVTKSDHEARALVESGAIEKAPAEKPKPKRKPD